MRTRSDIIYGNKTGDINNDTYIELFMNDDGRVGINFNCKGDGDVFQDLKLKKKATYDELLNAIRNNIKDSGYTNHDDVFMCATIYLQSEECHDKYVSYDVLETVRPLDEILEYEEEAFDMVWLVRSFGLLANGDLDNSPPDIADAAKKNIKRICESHGIQSADDISEWEYGYWSGILSTLRWVLGEDKDCLDT